MQLYVYSETIDIPAALKERRDVTWMGPNIQGAIPDAHLYIWDFSPDFDVQSRILSRNNAQHLLVIDSKFLDYVTGLQNDFCILLKPVAPFTIKAFVELALGSSNLQRHAREAEELRVDRDTLLQYVLEVNIKLQQYDQERSNFLARALHDFRAPLTTLHGYCGLLTEGKLGKVTRGQQDLLERMQRSTSRLARLAGSTLDLLLQGRVERRAERRESNIGEIVDRALGDVTAFVDAKQLRVQRNLSRHDGKLFVEPEPIQQVFVNLLENSCRFAPACGTIEIWGYPVSGNALGHHWPEGITRPSSGYRIDMLDSGPGVPAELATKIFEEYASYSGNADRSGGGLGLAICKSIVTAHAGTIWASSSCDGGRFSFILPLSEAGLASEREPAANLPSGLECVQSR
ncbi:MAG: sensor histidine kinase [Bryobacteraceae bacterium]